MKPAIGDRVEPLTVRATLNDMLLFSAATFNAHRIHVDRESARTEGFDSAVVQAHLHGVWFSRAALSFGGDSARLARITWRNLHPLCADSTATIEGTVSGIAESATGVVVDLDLVERDQAGHVIAESMVTIETSDRD